MSDLGENIASGFLMVTIAFGLTALSYHAGSEKGRNEVTKTAITNGAAFWTIHPSTGEAKIEWRDWR